MVGSESRALNIVAKQRIEKIKINNFYVQKLMSFTIAPISCMYVCTSNVEKFWFYLIKIT